MITASPTLMASSVPTWSGIHVQNPVCPIPSSTRAPSRIHQLAPSVMSAATAFRDRATKFGTSRCSKTFRFLSAPSSSSAPNSSTCSTIRTCSLPNRGHRTRLIRQPSARRNFDSSQRYTVQQRPATVLKILQEKGVYKNLYFGMNMATPKDLWKQDSWYRTSFTAPAGRDVYSLIFKGVNYRADIWLNGHKVAN